jgi:cytochrome c553
MLIVQESRNATCRRLLREAAALLIAIGSVPAWFESGLRAEDARASDHFEKRVRPLLIERCHKCHAAEKTKGGLRLDSAKSLRQGGESGAVVVPGKPDESLLIQAVRHENGLKMPPDGKLNAAQIADLVTWVKSGAVWANADSVAPGETPVPADKDVPLQNQIEATRARFTSAERNFWAYQPVKDVSPPDVTAVDWIATPIDRFILSQLEANGLHPAAAADKRTLIRRVTFDLTGLPPAPEEIGAFLKDESAEAYEKVVKRLLDSPHYGERWGRHWLDVVRYADSTANDANAVMRYAWRYRNYVIDSFNRDLPYDQFLIEQLAGDLLPPSDDISTRLRRTIATGFLMVGPKALAETDKEQSRLDIVDDQMDVTGRALLGLTLACARCHDHKFDAIRAVDYYAMAGIFRSTEPFQDEARNSSMWWEFPLFQAPGEKPFMVMAPKEATPRNLRVHLRGNRFTLGALVPRGFLQIISPEPPDLDPSHSGRLELARWIASPQNPLHGEPHLAAPFRTRDRGDERQLWRPWRATDASRVARFSGRAVRVVEVVD